MGRKGSKSAKCKIQNAKCKEKRETEKGSPPTLKLRWMKAAVAVAVKELNMNHK
jgi:hypothetical protein